MGSSTIYDVKMVYSMDDRAAKGAKGLHEQLHAARKEGNMLTDALREVGMAAAGFLGIREGYKALVGFNDELEQMKISLSAIMELQMGGTFDKNRAISEDLMKEFQAFSKTTTVTTKDVMQFATGVSSAVFGAGGSMKEFVNITEMGVVAAKVFGQEAGYASLELQEMMSGTVSKRMRFAMQLLHGAHVTEEQFRQMNARQRLNTISGVLNSDAMKEAAKAQAGSFAGVTSTLKDNLEIMIGQVGLPLFKAITKEVQNWNEWIEKNQGKLNSFVTGAAQGLLSAFRAIRDVIAWIADHGELIKTLAVAFAGFKVASGASGLVFGGLKMFEKFTGEAATGLGAMASQTNLVIAGLSLFYAGLSSYADIMVEKAGKERESQGAAGLGLEYASKYGIGGDKSYAYRLAAGAKDAGALRVGGDAGKLDYNTLNYSINYAKLRQQFGLDDRETNNFQGHMEKFGMSLEASEYAYKQTIDAIVELGKAGNLAGQRLGAFHMFDDLQSGIKRGTDWISGLGGWQKPMAEKANVNVTIQKIEVVSDDPDRFVFGMIETFRDAVKNPSSAVNGFREG